MADKSADLAGPGIGSYRELERVLPGGYGSLLSRRDTQRAIVAVKQSIEENLCRELNHLVSLCRSSSTLRVASTTCLTVTPFGTRRPRH